MASACALLSTIATKRSSVSGVGIVWSRLVARTLCLVRAKVRFEGLAAKLEFQLAIGVDPGPAPPCRFVEPLGAGSRLRRQPCAIGAGGEQPVQHRIVQPAAEPATLVRRIDEQRPDVAGARSGDRETGDPSFVFHYPAA